MSNNIYNILGKLNALTPKETPEAQEQKPVYESVEAKGSVLEGVAQVEARLTQLFAEDKANEDMIAKKDYDGDGKKESPQDEYMGSKDKAIKKATDKKDLDEETHGQYLAQKEKEAQQSGKSSFQAFKQTHAVDGEPGVEEEVEPLDENWVVHKDGKVLKTGIKQHKTAKAHAEKHGAKVNSAEWYHDNVTSKNKPGVSEEVEEESLEEGFEDLQKYLDDKNKGAKQGGGEGKKKGTRYGGENQDDDEASDEPAVKGRPKKDKFAEGFGDLEDYMKKKSGPQPSGDSGVKQGKRYGGSAQNDDEASDEPAVKGRPKKDKFAEVAPPGAKAERMVKHIKKGYAKDGKLTPKEKSIAYATTWKAHNKNKLKEGVNFAEMMREADANADELLTELQMEIAEFKKSGNMGDKLRDVLELHKFSKKKPVVDEVVMPAMEQPMAESGAFVPGRVVYWRGKAGRVDRVEGNKCFVNKANGEMDVWPTRECSTEKQSMMSTLGKDIKDIGQGVKNFVMNKPEPMDEELNELAKLAGLAEAKTCNQTMEGKKCPVHGLKECGSGMYESAKPDYIDLDKDGDKEESMKDAADDAAQVDEAGDFIKGIKRFVKGKQHPMDVRDAHLAKYGSTDDPKIKDKEGARYDKIQSIIDRQNVAECGPGTMSPMSSMGQEEGNFSVNTSFNSDGTKSVSVNATGNQADALAQMLKMAGLAAHQSVHGDEMSAEQPAAIVIQAGPEEQVEEERDIEYANTPDEEVENVDAIMHQGNDLNREKEQYAGMPKAGDNPMATRESIEMPARISRMLEGVKLAKG